MPVIFWLCAETRKAALVCQRRYGSQAKRNSCHAFSTESGGTTQLATARWLHSVPGLLAIRSRDARDLDLGGDAAVAPAAEVPSVIASRQPVDLRVIVVGRDGDDASEHLRPAQDPPPVDDQQRHS